MNRHPLRTAAAILLSLSTAALAQQASQPTVVKWSATDRAGASVEVPADRTAVLAFVRADQPQSKEALASIRSAIPDAKSAKVVVIVSGQTAAQQAGALAGSVAWPVVVDPDFAASGQLGVHVWPTTVVVRTDGTQVAHIAGLPSTYAVDLQAYLDYAAKRLDEASLQKRLTTRQVVTDSPDQAAARHLQVAQRLLDNDQPDRARDELVKALKSRPDDGPLQLELARIEVALGEFKTALDILDHLPADSVPAWRLNLTRGRALIGLQRWDQAAEALPRAIKLNPNPAEAHYLLGQVHQHRNQWQDAAEQYRLAFETSPLGLKYTKASTPAK